MQSYAPSDTVRTDTRGKTEYQLVDRARTGDRSAFDRLAGTFASSLRGFLGGRVASQSVDDVVQETLIAAWTSLPRYEAREQATFAMWLYRIARNKAADWARGNARRTGSETPITPEDENRFRAPDGFSAWERRLEVEQLLRALSPEQRGVIELYYTERLTLAEIAKKTNRNLSSVKYHFYRAQELLLQARQAEDISQ